MQARSFKSTLEIKTQIQALNSGLDTEKADAFLDTLLSMLDDYDHLSCVVDPKSGIRVESPEAIVCESNLKLVVPTFRSLCSRLAVRCGEWSGREVSLFGDDLEFEHPTLGRRIRIRFDNQQGSHRIDLQDISKDIRDDGVDA